MCVNQGKPAPLVYRAEKNCLFPETVLNNRVGRSVKKYFESFFVQKWVLIRVSPVLWSIGHRKKLFISCNGLKKNRVARSVKTLWIIFFVQKYIFHAYFMLIGSWKG